MVAEVEADPDMSIHQLQLSYSDKQDRLVFRFNTTEKEEVSFYFTRRYVMTLWPALVQLLELTTDDQSPTQQSTADMPAPSTSLSKRVQLDFEHTQAITDTDYVKSYKQAETLPLGEQPALIIKSRLKLVANKLIEIEFISIDDLSVKVSFTKAMLHNFCNMLVQVEAKTDWQLTLEGIQMTAYAGQDQSALH